MFRRGERALRLLGREVVDSGRPWLYVDGWIYLYEVPPTQWAFEQQLAALMAQRRNDPAFGSYLGALDATPQQYCHFGITLGTMSEWESLVKGLRAAGESDPEVRESVTVCLLTGTLIGAPLLRVRVPKSRANGLPKTSDVMVDKILTLPRETLSSEAFGRLTAEQLLRVDLALRFWLGLE